MNFKNLHYLWLSAFLIVADQLSKWAVTELIIRPQINQDSIHFINWLLEAPGRLPPIQIEVFSFFNIVMVWNFGVSFGLFNTENNLGPILLSAFAFILCLCFIFWLLKLENAPQSIAISMVIGGALANTIDRIRFQAVIDFLDFHLFDAHWPAFNLADSVIFLGVALLIIHSLFFEKDSEKP